MSIRTEIQDKITDLVKAGTFTKITYSGDQVTDTGVIASPDSVRCNEVAGTISTSKQFGATDTLCALRDWRFEVLAEFNCEVDVSYFLLNQLKKITFNSNDGLVVITPSGDFSAEHPPRQAAHNGTKLKIGLTANIRR